MTNTTRTRATTKQGAKAEKINRQALLDSTSVTVSGFCNDSQNISNCYSYQLIRRPTLYHSITRLIVLILAILVVVYYFK